MERSQVTIAIIALVSAARRVGLSGRAAVALRIALSLSAKGKRPICFSAERSQVFLRRLARNHLQASRKRTKAKEENRKSQNGLRKKPTKSLEPASYVHKLSQLIPMFLDNFSEDEGVNKS